MIGMGLFRDATLIEGRMCFECGYENTLNSKIIMNNDRWLLNWPVTMYYNIKAIP